MAFVVLIDVDRWIARENGSQFLNVASEGSAIHLLLAFVHTKPAIPPIKFEYGSAVSDVV